MSFIWAKQITLATENPGANSLEMIFPKKKTKGPGYIWYGLFFSQNKTSFRIGNVDLGIPRGRKFDFQGGQFCEDKPLDPELG